MSASCCTRLSHEELDSPISTSGLFSAITDGGASSVSLAVRRTAQLPPPVTGLDRDPTVVDPDGTSTPSSTGQEGEGPGFFIAARDGRDVYRLPLLPRSSPWTMVSRAGSRMIRRISSA